MRRLRPLFQDLFGHINELTAQLAEAHMDLRDRKDMLELKRTKLDHAEKQLDDLRRKTVRAEPISFEGSRKLTMDTG